MARSRPASSAVCGGCSSAPSSCFASKSSRHPPKPGTVLSHQRSRARVAAVVLPLEQHPRRRAARSRGARARCGSLACSTRRCGACSPIRASEALTTNFAGQWLQLRNLATVTPRKCSSPISTRRCGRASARDRAVLRQHRPRGPQRDRAADRRLHVPQRAAGAALRHPRHPGQPFRRVTLHRREPPRPARAGQHPDGHVASAIRTSPVFRGKWILDNMLGTPPPDPPPNVPPLPEKTGADAARMPTMRERMAQHRNNPVCASCHAMIDPRGLRAREVRRDRHDGATSTRSFNPIDASGALPDGTKFDGVAELRVALAKRPDRFVNDVHREAAHLRARPRPRVLRHAGGPQDRARDSAARRSTRLSIAHPGQSSTSPAVLRTGERHHDHHEDGAAPPDIPARNRRGARAAVARRDGAGARRAGGEPKAGSAARVLSTCRTALPAEFPPGRRRQRTSSSRRSSSRSNRCAMHIVVVSGLAQHGRRELSEGGGVHTRVTPRG